MDKITIDDLFMESKRPVVYVGGTFDLFHWGHVNLLRQCNKIGDVVVALNTDEFIAQYKGKPPVMRYEERQAILLGCKFVRGVIKNIGGADSKLTINQVRPQFVVVGTDWTRKDIYKQMNFTQEWLDTNDITLLYIPYTEGISSTEVKKRINEKAKEKKN